MNQMPRYSGIMTVAFFAALGLPGLSGFISEAFAFAREFSGHSLAVLRYAREAVMRAAEVPLATGLGIEADLSTLAYQTRDATEGMAAFLEKRKPKFEDR